MNELNINEILKVEQLPKVYEDLEKIGEYLEKNLEGIEELTCTEENKQDVKNKRALINNTKTVLEEKRKEIKNKILEPYDLIEKKYKNEVMSKITNALAALDTKIAFIEDAQKKNIKELCESYFNEYALKEKIDFVTFKNMNLKVTLGLTTEKGLLTKKTQNLISEFIDKRVKDLELIKSLEHNDEMLIEYKKTLNCANSIAIVMDRYKQLVELQTKKEETKEQEITDKTMIEKIDNITAPKVKYVSKTEKIMIAFEVIADSTEDLKVIVTALKNSNVEFRQLKKVGEHYE